jgi:hypothetical protein
VSNPRPPVDNKFASGDYGIIAAEFQQVACDTADLRAQSFACARISVIIYA